MHMIPSYQFSHHLTASLFTSGRLESDGKMHVTLCQFIEPWDDLTPTQRKSLTERYEMGCECKVENLKCCQSLNQRIRLCKS